MSYDSMTNVKITSITPNEVIYQQKSLSHLSYVHPGRFCKLKDLGLVVGRTYTIEQEELGTYGRRPIFEWTKVYDQSPEREVKKSTLLEF